MAERIDAYAHILTDDVIDAMEDARPDMDLRHLRTPKFRDVDQRLDHMDQYGIDKQVLTLSEMRMWLGADPDDVLRVARVANDEIRRLADEHPDRFIPVGTIPFLSGEYVDEARRCVEELDMVGVQTFSHIDGTFLDDEEFYSFYEVIDDAEVPIWIHPQSYDLHDYEETDAWLYSLFGWPFDTSIAVARLVFNGVLEQFQNLEIVTHHLGGMLPHLDERMRSWIHTREAYPDKFPNFDFDSFSRPIDQYFDRIYADTAVSSRGKTHTLQCGYEFFGPDNILFAADYPYGAEDGVYWMRNTIPAIERMEIPESEKQQIFSENVKDLVGI